MNAHAIPHRRQIEAPSTALQKVSAAIDKHFDALAILRLAEAGVRQLADELDKGSSDLAASVARTLELTQQMMVTIGVALERAEAELEKASPPAR